MYLSNTHLLDEDKSAQASLADVESWSIIDRSSYDDNTPATSISAVADTPPPTLVPKPEKLGTSVLLTSRALNFEKNIDTFSTKETDIDLADFPE